MSSRKTRKSTQSLNHPARSMGAAAAAVYLGLSRSTIDHSRITGELLGVPAPPYIRAGRTVRYLAADLDDWLDALPKFASLADEGSRAAGGGQ